MSNEITPDRMSHLYEVNDLFDLGTFCSWVMEHCKPLDTTNKLTLQQVYINWKVFKQSIMCIPKETK
jgi:hypothetical protein